VSRAASAGQGAHRRHGQPEAPEPSLVRGQLRHPAGGRQTFAEALAGTTFNTVERQRLAMIQREIFEQLAQAV